MRVCCNSNICEHSSCMLRFTVWQSITFTCECAAKTVAWLLCCCCISGSLPPVVAFPSHSFQYDSSALVPTGLALQCCSFRQGLSGANNRGGLPLHPSRCKLAAHSPTGLHLSARQRPHYRCWCVSVPCCCGWISQSCCSAVCACVCGQGAVRRDPEWPIGALPAWGFRAGLLVSTNAETTVHCRQLKSSR